MIERIKQLLKQARNVTAENHVPGGSDYEREIYVTFAELILKECLILFEEAKVNQEDDVDYGLEEAKNIIKEHFGVEE